MARNVTMYGIKNCDTIRKARAWLDAHGVGYDFHDYKLDGITKADLVRWCGQAGWEILLNRAGTTFRNLPVKDRANLNESRALSLMQAQPSMIKRPVLEVGDKLVVGFKPEVYAKFFS